MCGIFGIIPPAEDGFSNQTLKTVLDQLFKLSESRGKDASGIAVLTESKILVLKRSVTASAFIRSGEYKNLFNGTRIFSAMGHARMETNGCFSMSHNNQPVVKDGSVVIHNGIIVNDDDLWLRFADLKRDYQVDTEIINTLYRKYAASGLELHEAARATLSNLRGSYSLGFLFADQNSVLLATNTGSLYLLTDRSNGAIIFASEESFLESLQKSVFSSSSDNLSIAQMLPQTGLIVNVSTGNVCIFPLATQEDPGPVPAPSHSTNREVVIVDVQAGSGAVRPVGPAFNARGMDNRLRGFIEEQYQRNSERVASLRRCTRCILPETMPFIEFDEEGVCNFCRRYRPVEVRGSDALATAVEKYRRAGGKQECVVAFSGGRDSSYGLHYVKKELGLRPVAYSYDWGMLTDLGRRNQARMTGALGVEHILISADIRLKRTNIRKNVEAWLRRPDLGTVPLFMAGDKQYFYFANQLRSQLKCDLIILCENLLERTDFKAGFCGVRPQTLVGKKFYALSMQNTLKMLFYYGKQVAMNPRYINSSLVDTLSAFVSYYFIPHDFLSLYEYVRWDERVIDATLASYDWEIAADTDTTWRIGDGTTAFYNYIYYTIAGFTENDTFRSNQIREGDLDRAEALRIANRDNRPRPESMQWYCDTVELGLREAVEIINGVKKLY